MNWTLSEGFYSPFSRAGISQGKTPHLVSQKAVHATEAIIGVRTISSRKSITGSVVEAWRYYVTREDWSSNQHSASFITQPWSKGKAINHGWIWPPQTRIHIQLQSLFKSSLEQEKHKSLSLKAFCQDLIIVGFLELVKGFIFIELSFSEDR